MKDELQRFHNACQALHLEVSPLIAEDIRSRGMQAIEAAKGFPLDGKFRGTIYRHTDNIVVPDDQWVVFLAKDNAFPATLQFYREECIRIGAEQEQIEAVDRLIARVAKWRANHALETKIPDAEPGECH